MSAVPLQHTFDHGMDELVGLLRALDNGADFYERHDAGRIRWLEARGLARTCPPMHRRPPGRKRQPYFGAALTLKGRRLLALLSGGGS